MIPVAADAEQALAMIRSHPDGTVVDVRDEEEYITGHLADAVLLPVDEISAETAAEALPNQSSPVLVYCKTGKRSHAAAEKTSLRSDIPSFTTSAALAVGHTVSNKQIHKTEPIPFPGTGSMLYQDSVCVILARTEVPIVGLSRARPDADIVSTSGVNSLLIVSPSFTVNMMSLQPV